MKAKEAVNHPTHCGGADNPYEAIKVIEAWGLGFCLGNTVKYISRAGKKDALLQDLKKARWSLIARSQIWRRSVEKIDVLDHGFVRLVDHMGGDLSIVRAARVSHNAAWRAGENEGSDAKLINYLWRNKHTTPFEAVTFTFEIKAPIFVFRQWHRHRTWSFNELSARYQELPNEFYTPQAAAIGTQSKSSKQARDIGNIVTEDREPQREMYHATALKSFETYQKLLIDGWPRELARGVLPVATYSHMLATVDLLNLLKFLTLRCDAHAQYEIRVYADAMRELIRPIAPVAVTAWEVTKNG